MCILDDDDVVTPSPSIMRATGDRGWVDERGYIYFTGRLDRQIKRLGHRISLDHLEQVQN